MVEKARRAKVERSRPDADPSWEVFARDEADADLRYVGTIRADDAESAHAEATRLCCWFAEEVWVCPASELRKFSVNGVEQREPSLPAASGEERTHEF